MKHLFYWSIALLFIFTSCTEPYSKLEDGIYADINTNKGNIIIKLEYQKTPYTVANFVSLAEGNNPSVKKELENKPFYDGLIFHRVIPDFMIQGGDPDSNGSGGPGYQFSDEIHPDLKHDKKGILSMANAGPNSNGSQFFITHKETPWLDGKHSVFGEVVEGLNIVDSIAMNDTIKKITIIKKGIEAKKFNATKIFKEKYAIDQEKLKAEQKRIEAERNLKMEEINSLKNTGIKTSSGLIYKIIKTSEDEKPRGGNKVFINYAGWFINGLLFDSNDETTCQNFGKFDSNRAAQGGYQPFPFKYGDKQGLIPGFIEAIELLKYNEKLIAYLPANMAYGQQGAGNIIPPNTDLVFEIELLKEAVNQ